MPMRSGVTDRRKGKRWQTKGGFAADAQGLAAGHEQADVRTGAEKPIAEDGHGGHEMLGVVEH